MQYFDRPAFLNQSPQLFKQLCMSGGLERVFEIGPAFRAEKSDTYRHLAEFISFDIECSWANDDDVMGVLERMLHTFGNRSQKRRNRSNSSPPSTLSEPNKERNRSRSSSRTSLPTG